MFLESIFKKGAWFFILVFLILYFGYHSLRLKPEINLNNSNKTQILLLNLEKVFQEDHERTAILSDKTITLITTGDVIPARSVNYQSTIRKDFNWPFLKTAEVLKNADLTFINLESPLINQCPLTNEGMIFCGDKKNVEGLVFSGIDVANLANNHLENYGKAGVESTIFVLNNNGILTTGVNGPVFKQIKNTTFAFLGYNDIGVNQFTSKAVNEKITLEIQKAKQETDFVIVAFHWGDEYTSQPNQRQKALAHLAIDSGADLIIGNHPHWIQTVENYKNKFIIYAHGNFIFDQMWSQKTREGIIAKWTIYQKKIIDLELMPIIINDYGQPSLLEKKEKNLVLEEIKKNSLFY